MMFMSEILMKLRCPAAGILCLLFIIIPCILCSAGTAEEITALLNFVEQSNCTFIRNGKQYDSITSRQHIEKKYNYYKDKVMTTEDFIKYSATASIISGKPYEVICSGVAMNSSDWLHKELERIRKR